jgi:hypothetical protein
MGLNRFRNGSSKPIVSLPGDKDHKPRPVRSAAAESDSGFHFSFGARRCASSGARRLFVAQTAAVPPIGGPELARPQTILRPSVNQ